MTLQSRYPILYSFRRCPYAMRARLAIRYAGQVVALREVALRSKPADMLAISPKGTVPVLLLPDGTVLAQSLDIMRWACTKADPQNWLAPSLSAAGQTWLEVNDGPFKQRLDRYKYPDRHPDGASWSDRDEAVALMLAPMNAQLSQTPYLMGPAPCLVDFALMPFVRQFAKVDMAWFEQAPLPALQRWLAALLALPLFDQVMGKYEIWQPGQDPVLF
ncbi:MAG: glutathione S-transferase N-terminal domain-containing protein [Acidobacteriota bacterium]